jgi:hypothetical protein
MPGVEDDGGESARTGTVSPFVASGADFSFEGTRSRGDIRQRGENGEQKERAEKSKHGCDTFCAAVKRQARIRSRACESAG